MYTNELPAGGYDQVLFGVQQCLDENRGAVAQLGGGRFFLAGELIALTQYGAEHGDDNHPLAHVVVAIGAAGVQGDMEYRLAVVRPDPESPDNESLYVTVREDLFHTDPERQSSDDFDAGEGDDWLRRLRDARYSTEASWFHISSDDVSQVMRAANWGDEDMRQRLKGLRELEGLRRIKEWRAVRMLRERFVRGGTRPTDYDY